ncbi:hypothetical protein Ahy_A05g023726 [Arachis hypogaea]|uniref:Uncharacterized protein n=1 Tax=Arachis hypogaea TaxID=3818 RepID=A0A445D4A3_ARAHY|nr:hypothetical protein Ahy_A05g023726 [Arachis hypogaea]
MMANHESKFERLARQVERIARIIDYEEGERHNARENNEVMGLGFYMRQKLLNVHIPDLAHSAEKVRQVKLMKKENVKHRNEQKPKSKPFTRKEKFAYVTMESSEEELDFEADDMAELKKGPPYTYPKGIPSPAKMEKGKAIAHSFGVEKGKEVDIDK